jgi:hypothetical protein
MDALGKESDEDPHAGKISAWIFGLMFLSLRLKSCSPPAFSSPVASPQQCLARSGERKPLAAVWDIGFGDDRKYTLDQCRT